MLLTLLVLAAPAFAAECAGEPVGAQQVNALAEDALLAFATLDEEGFYTAADAAAATLPCVNEVFLAPYAASYHRLLGMRSVYDGETDAAVLSLRAATAIEPQHAFSPKVAPEGGKLFRAYEAAKASPPSLMVPFRAPPGLESYVDGAKRSERPANIPAIVQFAERGGNVVWTSWVPAGGHVPETLAPAPVAVAPEPVAVPPEPVAVAPEPVAEPVATEPVATEPVAVATVTPAPLPVEPLPPPPKPGGNGMWIGAAVTGTLTAALAGGAVLGRTRFDQNPTQLGFHATNGAYYGAIGMGVLTVGLIGGAAGGGAQ